MKKKSILKFLKKAIILLSVSIIFGVLLFSAVIIHINKNAENYCYTNLNDIPDADAVIVLGALVYNSGRPSSVLQYRLDNGYELYKGGKVKKIILSGDHGSREYDEVNAMKNYLLDKGVPREDLFLDHAGFNTYDSMYRAKEIFCVDSLIIATQEFHIQRSVYIARKLGIDAYGYPSEDRKIYNVKYLSTREMFAKIKAFADTEIIKRKPRYLGDPIPINGSGLLTEG